MLRERGPDKGGVRKTRFFLISFYQADIHFFPTWYVYDLRELENWGSGFSLSRGRTPQRKWVQLREKTKMSDGGSVLMRRWELMQIYSMFQKCQNIASLDCLKTCDRSAENKKQEKIFWNYLSSIFSYQFHLSFSCMCTNLKYPVFFEDGQKIFLLLWLMLLRADNEGFWTTDKSKTRAGSASCIIQKAKDFFFQQRYP